MKTKQTIKRILSFTKPCRVYLVLALASAVLSVSGSLYAPIIIGRAIDHIIGPGQVEFSVILRSLIILGAVILLSSLFQWLMTLCTNIVTYTTVKDLRTRVFQKLEQVPLRFIDSHAHGDLISRTVNDIDQISDGLIQGFSQLFTGVVTIAGTLCFMLSINVWIALVVVVLTPLSLFVASFIAKHTFQSFKSQSQIRGELGGYIEEILGGQKLVKAFGYEARSQAAFDEINKRLYDVGINAQFYSSITNPCTRFINGLVYAAVGLTGAIAAIQGHLSIGQLSSFLNYANQYTKPFNEITGVVTELQTAMASAQRVFSILDEPEQTPDREHAANRLSPGEAGTSAQEPNTFPVSLKHVDFSYSSDKRLIEDLSLEARSGQRIAIVGPTGCGKTTLINLLMRFYEVDGGEIRIGGVETRDMTRSCLRSQFGMVLQETWMFSGTVRDNIAYGRPEASDEEVVEAARAAFADGFIRRLPNGYDTLIGSDGGTLSQGQRQLLCIARVMLTKPPLLILDEATSSIDTRTELKVQRAFEEMMKGRTSFIVAHRLSTIREADCILVMKDGHIIEKGRHEELLALGGFYARLYQSQFAPASAGQVLQ